MFDRFSVQVRKRTVGVAVRQGRKFRFFSSAAPYFALEGKSFPSIGAIVAAAKALDRRARVQGNARARPAPTPLAPAAVPSLPAYRPSLAIDELEKPPEWFRWAVYAGIVATSLILAGVATMLGG